MTKVIKSRPPVFHHSLPGCTVTNAYMPPTGLERLPLAFRPFLGDRVKFHQRIEKAEYLADTNKIKFSWRDNLTEKVFQEEEFDYAFVAVPFTQVRSWRLPSESAQPAGRTRDVCYCKYK